MTIGKSVKSNVLQTSRFTHNLSNEVFIGNNIIYSLDRKPRRWHKVKHYHSAAVSDWNAHRDNNVAIRFTNVDTICKLYILEDSQFQDGLGHPP